jgi:uncharacterized protein (TIGR00299 family) protein
MKICYLDAFSGISGDMTVGALIDAGADSNRLVEGLESLGTGARFEVEKTKRRGIAASKFRVIPGVGAGASKGHRHLKHILEIIARSGLPARAKQNAAAVFQRLGEAEAKVHDIPLDNVHFHEVGAVDSICDIVGACVGLDLLDVGAVYSSAVNVGSGTVRTEHGVLPVPAPATSELLTGKPIYARGPSLELTTPTGAAIAATLAAEFGALPPMRVIASGYGAGDYDFPEHANVLRVLIGETSGAKESTTVTVLEANIDDSSPQVLGYAMERLLETGALDVTLTSVLMKKNRPGTLLRVIGRPEDQEAVETPHGGVRIKISEDGSFAPEYDDCRDLARKTGLPLKQILTDANLAYLKISR